MVKVTYEIDDDRVKRLAADAAKDRPMNDPGGFAWQLRYLVNEAFEAGRDFQKRYREDDE
jgi:hypothetical protein